MNFLDLTGVSYLWSKIKLKIEAVVTEKLQSYTTSFNTIKTEAQSAANEAKHYYGLTTAALNSLNPDVANVVTYAQLVTKHGQAITQIAEQLNATYNNDGTEIADDYTPGFIFVSVTRAEMDAIIEAGTLEDNKVYLVQEE